MFPSRYSEHALVGVVQIVPGRDAAVVGTQREPSQRLRVPRLQIVKGAHACVIEDEGHVTMDRHPLSGGKNFVIAHIEPGVIR